MIESVFTSQPQRGREKMKAKLPDQVTHIDYGTFITLMYHNVKRLIFKKKNVKYDIQIFINMIIFSHSAASRKKK